MLVGVQQSTALSPPVRNTRLQEIHFWHLENAKNCEDKHRARRWMDRKGDFQLPTFKLSSRTAGEMYKQLLLTNVLQEHLLTRDSNYFNPFLLQHSIISSTQLARHPNRSFPSFLFRIKILFTPSLYTHISDVG